MRPVDLLVEVDRACDARASARYAGQTRRRSRRRRRRTAASTSAGSTQPEAHQADSASIHGATGSVLRSRGNCTRSPMMRRTSRSSMVRQLPRLRSERGRPVDDGQRDRVERADLQPGQVGGAFAHLLLRPLVERDQAHRRRPAAASCASRWRARSVSTRVLPEPAGAMMRAAPPGVGDRRQLVGGEVGSPTCSSAGTVAPPCSTATTCTTGTPSIGAMKRSGPPSSQTAVPSARVTSPVAGPDVAEISRAPPAIAWSKRQPDPAFGVPCVDGVRPDEVVQLVDIEGESRTQLERRRAGGRPWVGIERDIELDDDSRCGLARHPQRSECRPRLMQCVGVDTHDRRRRPGLGYRLTRRDQHGTAEHIGAGTGCRDSPGDATARRGRSSGRARCRCRSRCW